MSYRSAHGRRCEVRSATAVALHRQCNRYAALAWGRLVGTTAATLRWAGVRGSEPAAVARRRCSRGARNGLTSGSFCLGLTPAYRAPTSAPGRGSPRPHLLRGWGSPLPHRLWDCCAERTPLPTAPFAPAAATREHHSRTTAQPRRAHAVAARRATRLALGGRRALHPRWAAPFARRGARCRTRP